MKKLFLFLMMFLCVSLGYSQKWNGLKSDSPVTIKKTLVSSSENEVVVNVKVDGYYSTAVSTPEGKQLVISGSDMAPMLVEGAPDLPMFPISIIIGDDAEMAVSVVDSEYIDIEGVEIAPSKGNLKRNINPKEIAYVYGEMYQQDAFYPAQSASLEKPYIYRDYRGQNIMVYPYAYNPVTKTLRVYTDMTISAKKVSDKGENRKVALRKTRASVDPEVKESYKRRFINYEASKKRDFIIDEGEMLIVCVDKYVNELTALMKWKNISGRPTKIVPVSETGTLDDLKNYLKNYYQENPELTFVMLVGEYDDLPPYQLSVNSKSDNYYGMLEGNDYYEEVLIGRLSVANDDDATVQVNKIIHYERDIDESDTWLTRGAGIGADEGPGHRNEFDYEHIDYIRDTLLNYTYTEISQHYDGINNPTAESMSVDFNEGLSIINYCNHGYPTGWLVADFDIDDVHQLTNDNKLPVIWSVACNNGQFETEECFGESWMRATNPSTGEATGAVGGMFSWISQPWIPPMFGQDEMVAILTEWRPNYKHTLGGASLNGNMYILDVCPDDYGDTHNTWFLFGDPTMMMRTATPKSMNVSISPAALLVGMSSLTVNADTEFGIATLSIDGEVIASSYVENGVATLSFPVLTNVAKAKLVVIGYNRVTDIREVDILPNEGSYVILDSYDINQEDGRLDHGDDINLSLNFINVGSAIAENVEVTLSSDSEYVTMNNTKATIASIASNEKVAVENQLNFTVASNIPDNTSIKFKVTCSNGTESWESAFTLIAHAPIFSLDNIVVDDDDLQSGERAKLNLTFNNIGGGAAYNVITKLESSSPDVKFDSETFTTEIVNPNSKFTITADFTVAENLTDGSLYEIGCNITAGHYQFSTMYELVVGSLKENFETGDFSAYDWTTSSLAWVVTEPGYEGTYCVASPLRIQNNKTATLTLNVEILSDGKLSFYRKVSSEKDYDHLIFYIDNEEIAKWSGELDWEEVEFDITKGVHDLKWEYVKDLSGKDGDDRVYIDYIVFPPAVVHKLDVDDIIAKDDVVVYPNPTTGIINIETDTAIDVVIYNYQGQSVMKQENILGQIDLTELPSGMYLVEIMSSDNRTVRKIIKK